MDHYGLNPDMVKDHLMDLQIDKKDPLSGVSTQTKSSLTRTYNTRHKSSIKTKKPKRVIGKLDYEITLIWQVVEAKEKDIDLIQKLKKRKHR